MITAKIAVYDEAMPRLREIAAQIKNPIALHKDVGRRIAGDLKKHFKAREAANPNKLGGERTHFWLEIRDAVQQPQAAAGGVEIEINDARLAAKVHGARVVARNASALTIPLHPKAHGRRASVFEDEEDTELFRPPGTNVLMAELGGEVESIYALVKSANIPKDPDALPPRQTMLSAIADTAEKHYSRLLARAAKTSGG